MAALVAVLASTHHPFYDRASTSTGEERPPFADEWVRKVETFRETLTWARPDVLVMFGVAEGTRHLRIETSARNAISRVVPDAGGHMPASDVIADGFQSTLPLKTAAQSLMLAARSAGKSSRAAFTIGFGIRATSDSSSGCATLA